MQLHSRATTPVDSPLDEAIRRIEQRRPLMLSGVRGSSRGWLAHRLTARLAAPLVMVAESFQRAETLLEDARFFCGPAAVSYFPHWDTMPYDAFSPQKDLIAQRFQALLSLRAGTCRVLVTTAQALMQQMLPLGELERTTFHLQPGERYPRPALVARLMEAGYSRVDLVEAPGEFSVRGDIIDVFTILGDHPARLNFFDDELETLHAFDVTSQRSLDTLSALTVYPASEGAVSARTAEAALRRLPDFKTAMQPEVYRQLWSYLEQASPFPGFEQLLPLLYGQADWLLAHVPPQAVVLLDEPPLLNRRMEEFHEEVLREHEMALQQGQIALPVEALYRSPAQVKAELSSRYGVYMQALRQEGGTDTLVCPFADNVTLRSQAVASTHNAHTALEQLVAALKDWRAAGVPVYLAARSETSAERMRQVLAQFELGTVLAEVDAALDAEIEAAVQVAAGADPGKPEPRDMAILRNNVREGFRVVDGGGETRFALVTEDELLGEKARQRHVKKSNLQNFVASLGDLKPGDAVVHVEYGIGRYEGLRTLDAAGAEGDFLVLSYVGDDKVYVPVYHFNQVQKYTGVEGRAPALSRLGDGSWQRAKGRAAREIHDMAEELVRVQAARRAREGTAFPPNEALIAEFEEAFPYEETEDQSRTIQEVLRDMCAESPMDRLVCGDVGFGKTEVAMRAAYLAVLGGKQVLMLVPTTILAQQHFDTFTRRFADFPVNIDVLSRFRNPKDQRAVAQAFANGEVDILIGTHRLLSKDIKPKDLGLLIIDEEQRFGVGHKEKIKQLKTQVDVVTLSATPIPRTLQMSLTGVRDLSIINTPPMDRVAIRTRLVKSSDYIIQEAVEREVRRGGQVFFVHNRVETIHAFGSYLRSLLPRLRMAIAHGQMAEKQLEEVMLAFVHGDVDLLLTTTIIESGLDIPRANTIIINNADHYGLSQLYQLRGRVGRSNLQAYAYLLTSPEKILTEVAQKRLTLLQELNDLGAGFRIASHDLEIRGAGNLLGHEQSGHINALGLELFTQMVNEAVAELQGEAEQAAKAIDALKLDLGFPYLLPEGYIESTQQRLDLYKRLAEVTTEAEMWDTRQMLEDRFGELPAQVQQLFNLIHVRVRALTFGLSALERKNGQLMARFGDTERVNLERLMALVGQPESELRLLPDDRLLLGPMPGTPEGVLERLSILDSIVQPRAA